MMVIDSNLQIQFYDSEIAKTLELEMSTDYTGRNLLEIVDYLARRGDFGPGDPAIFIDFVKSGFEKSIEAHVTGSQQIDQGFKFLTPSGRRVEFCMDVAEADFYILGCRDITKQFIEQHALKVAMDSSSSGYLIYDTESQNFAINGNSDSKLFSETLGKELSLESLKAHINAADFDKLKTIANQAHAQKERWSSTFRIKNAKGETIWIKAQATPQIAESGFVTSYIIFYTEVTSQLRIQDGLRKAKEISEKSLSAKNAFLGRLSHEIRTPMNAVVGIADALIHHNGDPKIQPKLELIQTSAEKIIRIVDESLEHTKLAEAKIQLDPHDASPRAAVESVCALWEQKAVENDIDLICRIGPDIPETMIFDSHRFEQCLNNLLSNAVKFSPSGKVQVVLTTLEKNGNRSLVTVVKDNGIGMTDKQLASLFEAYTQADGTISGRFGGTGLGMNITKQLIELMDGKITARSELGSGTVIALTLPIEIESAAKEPSENSAHEDLIDQMLEEATPAQSEYSHLKVLVVDDNATNHMVVTSLLDTLVKEIGIAENGIEAIDALKEAELQNAQYDLVLMDIHMPIMDGIEATLGIRGSQEPFSGIPIIALTADPQYQQKRLCKNIGMDEALAKPIKLTELLGAIDQVFIGRHTSTLAA